VREREGERKRQEETNRRRSRWIQAAAVILRRAAVASGRERARLRERSRSAGESSVLAEDKVLHVGPTGCNFAKKNNRLPISHWVYYTSMPSSHSLYRYM
jgi:hypothetical protein